MRVHKSDRLPVTLLMTSFCPMMARTVREPGVTFLNTIKKISAEILLSMSIASTKNTSVLPASWTQNVGNPKASAFDFNSNKWLALFPFRTIFVSLKWISWISSTACQIQSSYCKEIPNVLRKWVTNWLQKFPSHIGNYITLCHVC